MEFHDDKRKCANMSLFGDIWFGFTALVITESKLSFRRSGVCSNRLPIKWTDEWKF